MHRTTKAYLKMNRKDFFNTAGRLLILGGISASAGYLVLNNKVTTNCSVSPTCKSCGKFSKCELPQAKEIKDGK
jgi:hypothetical protein